MLTGEIPLLLGELQRLEMLNLSHNELSGTIPHIFEDMRSLTIVDISYNQLEGPLPNIKAFTSFEAFKNNKGLCAENVIHLNPCRSSGKKANKFPILIIVGPLLFLFSLVIGFYFLCQKLMKIKTQPSKPSFVDLFAI